MSSYAERYTVYQVMNALVRSFPFPHVLVRDVFEPALYRQMIEHLPSAEAMRPIKDLRPVGRGYSDDRFVLPLEAGALAGLPTAHAAFWSSLSKWLLGASVAEAFMHVFRAALEERFKGQGPQDFFNESMLVDDRTRYSLGPHSDSPSKVVTVLFYLAADTSRPHLGTSIYAPRDPAFRCPGGPHHPFDRFDRVFTMPYLPNTMFAFVKTDASFHGVEPIADENFRRHLLFYDLKVVTPGAKKGAAEQPGRA